jgi:invasion protein IalB
MQIIVPLGVALAKGATVVSDSYTSAPLHFRRCDRGGCYVEMLVDNKVVDAIGSATTAKLKITADGGKDFNLNLPLAGFPDAHTAMVEFARQKATPAKPAAAP